MNIRFATVEDTEKLLKIYEQYINTNITFEYKLPSKEEFMQRIIDISKDYPYLVLENDNQILGYAYAHRFKERDAYAWGAELSIYMDKNICAKGYGKKLYSTLIEILKLQGVKTVYACVTGQNINSEKFHEKLGFKTVGTFHNAGFKNNTWHNIVWFEKQINDYNLNPNEIISVKNLNSSKIQELLVEI